MNAKIRLILPILILLSPALPADEANGSRRAKEAEPSACVTCHSQLDGSPSQPQEQWSKDVHLEIGLGCHDCHGGDPSPDLADDIDASMSPARGFKPAPGRLEIAKFCGGCHANAEFMKQFNPQARVDQYAEYLTSVHGKGNSGGDPVPATCTDCHGVHGIRSIDTPESSVYATNVPGTCAACHADAAKMSGYGIGTGQYDDYMGGAHAAALLQRGDTAAPACNDCHGNHGAAPPGVKSVANVCGQCHGREAQLFRASFKKDLFDEMEATECTTCHGNHRNLHPSPELFRSGSAPRISAGTVTGDDPFAATLGDLEAGETVEAEWTVVLDPHLEIGRGNRPVHEVVVSSASGPAMVLDATVLPGMDVVPEEPRQESNEVLTASLTIEPLSGNPVEAGSAIRYRLELRASGGEPLRSLKVEDRPAPGTHGIAGSVCLNCHTVGDECDVATEKMYAGISTLDLELRSAERLLRRAEVAGMDVSEVLFDLNSKGKTAAVEARALVHSFDTERMIARTEEGREVAAAAHQAGEDAWSELQFRRRGLAVSLLLVGFVLLGLFLKIRSLGRPWETT